MCQLIKLWQNKAHQNYVHILWYILYLEIKIIMIRSSRWLPWSSLGTLKLVFNVPSDDQGSRPDDLSISLCVPDNGRWRRCHMSLVHTWSRPPLYSSHGDTSCHPTPDNTACSVHHSLNLQDITKVHSIYNFFSLKTSISFMKMLILKYLPFCSGLNVWTLLVLCIYVTQSSYTVKPLI